MNATTAHGLTPVAAGARVTQRRVFLSEWTKLRSVRSTRWALLANLAIDHRPHTTALAAQTPSLVDGPDCCIYIEPCGR